MSTRARSLGWASRRELQSRARRLKAGLEAEGWDGVLLFQNADLLYICGTVQAEAVFVPRRGRPLVLARPPLDRVRAETPWPDVEEIPRGPDLRARLEAQTHRRLNALGLELDVLPVSLYRRLASGPLAGLNLTDASPLLRQVRAVKSRFEIEQMKTAAEDLDRVLAAVPEVLRPGVTELELEGFIVGRARARGHQGLVRMRGFNQEIFFGHVLSGPNGLVQAKVGSPTGGQGVGPGFGQGAGPRPIGPGEVVSVDLCGAHGGYLVDQARLYCLGSAPDQVQRAYTKVRRLMDGLTTYIRPGLTGEEVYQKALALAARYGLAQGFMGLGGERCPFVGHGIGLEMDEWPVLGRRAQMPLAAGMTFALEPRVFLPGLGVVGLEDTYILREDGPEILTCTPREIMVLPA